MTDRCPHDRLKPEAVDQTAGAVCMDCDTLMGYCWGERHLSERTWNLACQNDPECKPCPKSRRWVCFLCGTRMVGIRRQWRIQNRWRGAKRRARR